MHRWLVPWVVQPIFERFSGRRPWSEARRLRELQWRSAEELEARAMARLQPLLRHAMAEVPYYRALFQQAGLAPADIRTSGDLARLPISNKQSLRAGFPRQVVAERLVARRGYRLRTSGSSGTPFEFYSDRAELESWVGSYYFFREWDGTALWDSRLRIVGGRVGSLKTAYLPGPPDWARRLVSGEWVVKVAGSSLTVAQLVELAGRFARRGPYTIDGYPSYVAHLAAQLLAAGVELPAYPRVVRCSAETLTATDAALIGRAFRCPVFNHYSSWEVPHLAQTCPDNRAVLHVNSERAIVRVVRPDGSEAGPGEQGRIVLTSLWNNVMPIVNYDIGDLATVAPGCGCGRGWPTIQSLDGRTTEMIRAPDGRVFAAATLSMFLTDLPVLSYIWQWQGVQTAPDALVLRVVPTARFDDGFSQRLRDGVGHFLGGGIEVMIEPVEQIEAEPSGKHLIIKSNLPAS